MADPFKAPEPKSKRDQPTLSNVSRGGSTGAAAAVTGDNADAGEWPDDINSDRGSSSETAARASSGPPDVAPLQTEAMSDGTGGLPVPPLDADEVALRANLG